ncbi:MAG TPA: D-aminoacyl-tRNA deacylase [Polyangiaceae bacterium]|jgi:D-tyrosyl-tRNA(Tyr) deacylase|nr:D-aminoacyl-tRNA deacylase [Polyangiaceae bacterium]
MRAVVQRVLQATVTVEDEVVGRVALGVCVFVGVGRDDSEEDAAALADKVVGLRIFEDDAQKMNLSVLEVGGALLAVSQFTLFGDVRKGKRPSFSDALEPARAEALFEQFCSECRTRGARVETGRFRSHMRVELENDGPVTILIDTKRAF